MLDEWAAYLNGATQFIEDLKMGRRHNSISDLLHTAHFAIYSLCMAVAVDASQQKGVLRYDDTQLRLLIAYQWNRMMNLFADGSSLPGSHVPISYYREFALGAAGKGLRAWSRRYFGRAWVSAVMRASDA
jgi:hypothetical protein